MLDGVVVPGLAFRGAQVDEACVERVHALTWCGVRNLDVGSVHFPPLTRIKSLRTPK